MGTWPYSFLYCGTTGLFQLAKDMIEGKSSGNVQNDVLKAFQAITPGCEWKPEIFTDANGRTIDNHYILSMETYIFGKGYTNVINSPIPEKYYSIR